MYLESFLEISNIFNDYICLLILQYVLSAVFPIGFVLNLKNLEPIIGLHTPSLWFCHKLSHVLE